MFWLAAGNYIPPVYSANLPNHVVYVCQGKKMFLFVADQAACNRPKQWRVSL